MSGVRRQRPRLEPLQANALHFVALSRACQSTTTTYGVKAKAGRIAQKLMAIVIDTQRGRVFLPPTETVEAAGTKVIPDWRPTTPLYGKCRVNASLYGFDTYGDLFTPRQLVALTTFGDLIEEARDRIREDALASGLSADNECLDAGGCGAKAYSEAVSLYLAFAVDRVADYGSTISTWRTKDNAMRSTLASQAIPMTWDYAEGSPFASSSSGFIQSVTVVARAIELVATNCLGHASQCAAQAQEISAGRIVSTDPPYYNNIGYADLSDFFYVWLRRNLQSVFPELLATIAVPKQEELVATPYRHRSNVEAEAFFLEGMTQAMRALSKQAHPAVPLTIYYAFKQSESQAESGTTSTGWETFLEAVHRAGLALTGTWPMRTEGDNRQIGLSANALASSIVLVCRSRSLDAGSTSRRAFLRELNVVLQKRSMG